MDPISVIVGALVSGAAAALKDGAVSAVKSAYEGLREVIRRKFGDVDIEVIEKNPDSKSRQDVVKEELEKAGAGG